MTWIQERIGVCAKCETLSRINQGGECEDCFEPSRTVGANQVLPLDLKTFLDVWQFGQRSILVHKIMGLAIGDTVILRRDIDPIDMRACIEHLYKDNLVRAIDADFRIATIKLLEKPQ